MREVRTENHRTFADAARAQSAPSPGPRLKREPEAKTRKPTHGGYPGTPELKLRIERDARKAQH